MQMIAVLSNWCFLIRGLNIKVNRQALRRGKQGFAEVPELELFEIEINNILSGMLSLST